MAHFAHVNKDGIVTQVIVIEEDVLANSGGWVVNGEFRPIDEFIQTSYNTHEGVHRLGGTPLRKNFAGQGYLYDKDRDAFIPPQPYLSWTLDEEKCVYVPPVEEPVLKEGEVKVWNEDTTSWDIINK